MRILHVVPSLEASTGGPPVVAQALAAAQATLGHDVHLASYANDLATPTELSGSTLPDRFGLPVVPGADRLRVHLTPPGGRVRRALGWRARRWFAQLPQTDVTHLHGMWDPFLTAAADVAGKRGGRYVVAPHGMLDPWSLSQKRLKKRIAMALAFRRLLNGSAFLHALNADEADLIRPLGLRCPIEVIPNGIFPEEVASLPPRGAFRAAHPELGDAPYVLFLSRLHMKKGLDYLADAFAILSRQRPDVRLVVAGPDGGARSDFEARVKSAGLTERVHVVGPLYKSDKYAAYVDAAAFCLPSRQEGFSMAILEALASGVPVVVSDACHFPEIAAAGAGDVVPLISQAVADALARVLADEPSRQQMGRAGRDLVLSRFTWPAIAGVSLSAYNSGGRHAGPC